MVFSGLPMQYRLIMHGQYHILSRAWSPQAAMHDDKNMVQPIHYEPILHRQTGQNHILLSFLYSLIS